MEKVYNPKKVEKRIYNLWMKGKYFTPKIEPKKKPFVITIPLPNVTGGLHAGHAMYVIEDIMARYHRMLGEPTLWLPGFDHASIAVEYLVSKQLAKEGKTKKEVGREEFLKRAHQFANDSKQYIREQLKLLGFSLDWTREAYTMDETRSRAVGEAFNHLYKKGLIYQGERIINWCPTCQTALSDLENVHEEEKGKLYYIKYGPITIATTRPETMFADVAVAIHPENKKFQKLIGKKVPLPLTKRQIPIITDEAVDLEFGTGALKITPAHDELDFEIGERHQLEKLACFGPDGKLTKLTGKYAGLSVIEAREKVVQDLEKQGFIEKVEDYTHSVGHCQRCGEITEPLISKQWFVKIKPLAEKAIKAVKGGKIKIIPKRFEKVYFNWMENIHDWCISRQLWWGHKIPLEGEDDILDTWFSSSLWPISVFGWPGNAETQKGQKRRKLADFEYFYPTTVRETGYDILFFWVAREIMMCLEMTGKIPFEIVYLHGLVRDEKGRKFSKTKGIGFDPLEIIEKHGADALRMAMVVGNPPGNDLKIEEDKVVAYRNFCNKIWNAARFVLAHKQNKRVKEQESKNKDDEWILEETDKTVKRVTKLIDRYRFDLAAETIYHFFWHTFCDKYLEMSKKRRDEAQPTLLSVLDQSLRLLHPFMPFVTEQVYQLAKSSIINHQSSIFKEKALIISQWPK